MSLDSVTIDLETQDILFPSVEFALRHKLAARIVGNTTITQVVSSSVRGILNTQYINYAGYTSLPADDFSVFESSFDNMTAVRGECFQILTAFTGNSQDCKWAGYGADSSNSSIVGIRKKGEIGSGMTSSGVLFPDTYFKRTDTNSTNAPLLASTLGEISLPRSSYQQVLSLPNPDAYDITLDTIGGTATFRVNDTRQLYNGEWEGTSFVANDQILSQTQFEGDTIEFIFNEDFLNLGQMGTGGYNPPFAQNFANPPGFQTGSVIIDSSPTTVAVPPTGSNFSIRSTSNKFSYFYPNTLGFAIPAKRFLTFGNDPNIGTDYDEGGVTHFMLPKKSTYSINGGPFQITASIEDLVNTFKPGDRFSLQLTKNFFNSGLTADQETLKVVDMIYTGDYDYQELTTNDNHVSASDYYRFNIENTNEVYAAFQNFGTMFTQSFVPSGPKEIYAGIQFMTSASFKLIKQKRVSLNTVFPTVGNINDGRPNKFYYQVDYETGLITPTNQLAIQNNTATLAQTPQSNYTITGICNSRYKGTKVTSPGINRIQ